MNIAYIGLGSNLGESENFLSQALADLQQYQTIYHITCSSFYRSSPVDSSGPDYINAVARLVTELTAMELLSTLQAIELKHGRQRPYHNAPRTLDLDILLFNDSQSDDTTLTLPHPRMHLRAFVLEPLLELYHIFSEQDKSVINNIDCYSKAGIERLIQAAKKAGQLVKRIE